MNRLRFAVVIHNHQPIGNFQKVVQQLTDSSYRPFLESLRAYTSIPFTLHISGPLLRWWENHDVSMVDLVGKMVDSNQIELLVGGFFEPILASISSADRRGQISMMREYLKERFGVAPQGLWLTERVWEGEIVGDLIAEGVRYVLVDDRHFRISGFDGSELRGYYLTESEGETLAVFPIDERLRYLIPFRPVDDLLTYLREIRDDGGSLVVYGDDGEKLGGWPGTSDWVYGQGWLARFLDGLVSLQGEFLDVMTCSQILEEEKPLGLCYLPTASYTEMEDWALPAGRLVAMAELTRHLGDQFERFKPFIRGGHWKNFLIKYPEANLLHKKVLQLSKILRRRKMVPTKILEELYASQCNDPYWHGIFGGLYLPHLRGSVWESVSRVEKYLRVGEDLSFEVLDLDLDGREEVWVHSFQFSTLVRPERGGSISEYTYFPHNNNYCNVLARRFEAYHDNLHEGAGGAGKGEGKASIHELLRELPPDLQNVLLYDISPRGLFVDKFFEGTGGIEAYQRSRLTEYGGFARDGYQWKLIDGGIVLEREEEIQFGERPGSLYIRKEYSFSPDGQVELKVTVSGREIPSGLFYGLEMSLFTPNIYRGGGTARIDDRSIDPWSSPLNYPNARLIRFDGDETSSALYIEWSPKAALWCYPILTVSQSEAEFERTLQGLTVLPHWPFVLGKGNRMSVRLRWRFSENSSPPPATFGAPGT